MNDGTKPGGRIPIRRRARQRTGALHVSAGVLVGLLLTGCAASGIRVLVVNKAGRPVQNLKIEYTGGSRTRERLKADASYRTTIELTGASGIDVEFEFLGGEKKTEKIKAQLEPGYTGDLRLEITPGGRLGWEKHLIRSGARRPKGSPSPGGPPTEP